MRLALVLFLSVLVSPFFLGAQVVEGYVITNTRDTLFGKLSPGTPAQRSVQIHFKATGEKEAVRFEPFQILGFCLVPSNEFYESKFFQLDDLADDAYAVFMRRDNVGPVRVYQFWNVFADRGYFQTFLQRGDEKLKEVDYQHFRQCVADFISDYEELADRVKGGDFKKKDLVKIANEYNEWKLRRK